LIGILIQKCLKNCSRLALVFCKVIFFAYFLSALTSRKRFFAIRTSQLKRKHRQTVQTTEVQPWYGFCS
jgi:hypothetical protein